MAAGPLRLRFDYGPAWSPLPPGPRCRSFYEVEERGACEVTLRIRPAEVPVPEPDEMEVTGDLEEMVFLEKGVRSRCNLAGRTVDIEVNPGRQPHVRTRLFCALFLLDLDCLAVHGAAVVKDGAALVFPGHSGAGKSTLARIAAEAGLAVLGDDTVVLGWQQSGQPSRPVVWGTPFPGDAGLASPGPAPLRGIHFIEHGDRDHIRPISAADGAARLVAHGFPPTGLLGADQARRTADRMVSVAWTLAQAVPAARMWFRPTPAFLELLP